MDCMGNCAKSVAEPSGAVPITTLLPDNDYRGSTTSCLSQPITDRQTGQNGRRLSHWVSGLATRPGTNKNQHSGGWYAAGEVQHPEIHLAGRKRVLNSARPVATFGGGGFFSNIKESVVDVLEPKELIKTHSWMEPVPRFEPI